MQPGLINKNPALSKADLKNSYLILIGISFQKKMLLICFMTTTASEARYREIKREGIKILSPKQMIQRLPIAQVHK